MLDELNGSACVQAYRVLLWTDRRLEASAALIRHELEHACQIDVKLEVEKLHRLAKDVIGVDSKNSDRLYQEIPAEADANAAAGTWARSYFGSDRIDRLLAEGDPDAAALRAHEPPPSPADLPVRMVAFLASIADQCREWSQQQNAYRFALHLDRAWRGAGEIWERMAGPGQASP